MQTTHLQTYTDIKNRIVKYQPEADFTMLDKAYALASSMHKAQKRESGEPYIVHPLAVAGILADMELDMEAIAAGLLHDVIEDTPVTFDDIKTEFGEDIALLVEGVTKLDKIQFHDKAEQQIESLRKMFLAMAKDIRVILIKLADRLHNMRTLKNMPPAKRLIKARETLEVYAPLAHRLGISKIKWELEDLSLRHLDSVAYYEIVESINKKKNERDAYIDAIKDTLAERLRDLGIHYALEGRAKSFYSIFKKMYTQNKSIDEIYDLFAVRIIVDSVSDCYTVLGMVHELYVPIPGRFKDYIAMPKPNMYQSLHTTVMGPEGSPCEIQIRTFEMHRTAEHGIAAHWKYKEGHSASGARDSTDAKFAWIRQLLDIQKDLTDEEEFMRTLKIDLFTDEVFAFTPRGDVINLPAGSTPIDFAFAIHSAVGSKMMGAKVNSKIVPLDYQLVTGDIVEILTSSSVHGPSRDWLKICKTNQARSKINAWLKKEMREENILKGKEAIERELKRQGFTMAQLFQKENIEQCLRRYSFANTDDMYASIGYGTITAPKIITRLKEYSREAATEEKIQTTLAPLKRTTGGSSSITVHGIENCLVRISKCCMPIPGDDIIGYITKGRGVSVHRADCVNVRTEALSDEDKGRLIRCYWTEDQKGSYLSDIQIESTDRHGLLADITNVITDDKISIMALNSRALKNKMAMINLTLEVASAAQLNTVIKRLYTIPGVFNIMRLHQ